jgi:hypothetical protein
MRDAKRAGALNDEAAKLAEAAQQMIARLPDSGMRDLFLRRVRYAADDVQMLERFSRQAATPEWETKWLDLAETTLRNGQEQFRRLSELVERHGGPEKVQTVG